MSYNFCRYSVQFQSSKLLRGNPSVLGLFLSIGSIPLQKVTFLEHITIHFDEIVFFQHGTAKNHIRLITYNYISERKQHVAQKDPATYKPSYNQTQFLQRFFFFIFSKVGHYFEEHIFSLSNTMFDMFVGKQTVLGF